MVNRIVSSLLFFILIFTSCSEDISTNDSNDRPYDPWVFRSVLDDMPRAITVALDNDLWVAYSAEYGSLYKAWKGSVEFDGAVFTSAHGPQPLIIGDAYIHNQHQKPWVIKEGTDIKDLSVQYKGHRFTGDQVELIYELSSPDNQLNIMVYEKPEAVHNDAGQVGFERSFVIENLPSGKTVGLRTNVSSIVVKNNFETNGDFEIIEETQTTRNGVTTLALDGVLWMHQEEATNFTTFFTSEPAIENLLNPQNNAQASTTNEGLALISKSDCRTCHNINAKTVGPAYKDIAMRYRASESNIDYLVGKIQKGGTGVWGETVMTPHPDLPNGDVEKMVNYILGLVPESEKADNGNDNVISAGEYKEPASVEKDDLIMGSVVKVYNIPSNTQSLPNFSSLSNPIMGGIMPNFDNLSDAKFIGLTDNFSLEAEGYLEIQEDMEAIFRMWSDDGSKLYLNDELIVDHDGLHGTSSQESKVGLKKGYHKFRIEYFNGGGGKFLSFNWKPANKTAFEVVPQEIIYHDYNWQNGLSGLSLPMSSQRTIPGDQAALEEVHPSFTLSQARPDNFTPKVGGLDFLPDGRLAVSVWDAEGGVYLIDNVQSGDPSQMSYKRIASGLAEPLGLKVVDGDIYVMQKQELTRLVDTDSDDVIDEYLTVSNDWRVSTNFHEFGFGLVYKDNHFYATLAVGILPGGASAQPQIPDRGKVIKVNKETGVVEFLASGLRTPNGIGIGVNDEIFVADNQGDWLPASKILHIVEGAFYGGRMVDFEGTAGLKEKPPVVWLPQDEIGNSPSTPIGINVGPYKGQMIHGEVTNGGIKRVFVEEVDGAYQGALFRFTQGLEAGVNRIVWGPDGALYVGGIGNPGNWQHSGKQWYGLQRLEYNENSIFEMLAVRAKSNGIEIEFTEPLQQGQGWDKETYEVSQWYYKPTSDYGGPKLNETNLNIRSVNVSDDQKRVFLEIPGIKEGYVVYLHINDNLVSSLGHELWSSECWYTMNAIPKNTPGFRTSRSILLTDNTLTPEEKENGWELLFDGKTTEGWKGYKKDTPGTSWIIENGVLTLDSKKDENGKWDAVDGGDIMTEEEFDNFELSIDWKINNCGNSGIIFFVHEADEYDATYSTGPEMQILDNTCHSDAKLPNHRAGSLYDLVEPKYVTVNPAGEWNTAKILFNNGHLEQWLNGRKIVEIKRDSEEWDNLVKNSKFSDWPGFAKYDKGHIALQDHHDKVWFKNIKIKKL